MNERDEALGLGAVPVHVPSAQGDGDPGDAIDRFHAHLDVCVQCLHRPFDLCADGAVLLQAASAAVAD